MTRAPLKLTREMKVLLGLLLLVAAIGLWYILTSNRQANDTVTPQPPLTTDPNSTTVPVTPNPNPTATDPSGVGVRPAGQVDVEVIPPFPTGGDTGTDEVVTDDVPPTPGGINPDTALSGLPSTNPFRPLALAPTEGTPNGTSGTVAATPLPTETPVSVTPTPATDVQPIGDTGGPLTISPVPGSESATDESSGAFPIPEIPGGNGETGSADPTPVDVSPIPNDNAPVAVGPSGTPARGDTGSNNTGSNPQGTTPPGSSPQGSSVTTPPPAPPIAGVRVPTVTRLPSGTPSAAAPGTPAGNGTGNPAGGAASTSTAVPTPGTPQVITELNTAAPSTTTAPTANALDTFVQTQQLAFNAVVLGPVNTGIFRSKDGFVVVSVGQTLPDTQVTVKEVTATSATLSLGNNTTTLELDKR